MIPVGKQMQLAILDDDESLPPGAEYLGEYEAKTATLVINDQLRHSKHVVTSSQTELRIRQAARA